MDTFSSLYMLNNQYDVMHQTHHGLSTHQGLGRVSTEFNHSAVDSFDFFNLHFEIKLKCVSIDMQPCTAFWKTDYHGFAYLLKR